MLSLEVNNMKPMKTFCPTKVKHIFEFNLYLTCIYILTFTV